MTTPDAALEDDLRSVDVDVTLDNEGGATVHVRETLRGQSAVGWRNDLDEIPAAELEARFEESYASSVVPGARLKKLTSRRATSPRSRLVIDYELEVGFARAAHGSRAACAATLAESAGRSVRAHRRAHGQ